MTTAERVFRWCREQNLFPAGGHVTAALSGGADSVAMLHLLLALRQRLGLNVSAAHFNHHLRGAESDRDEQFCRNLCSQWDVPLRCGGEDVAEYARRTGQGVESAARELRYAFLRREGGLIATAHTADDQLETMLLHLTRGAALRGLAGIPPRRDDLVRPVLCLTREEIEAYLAEHGLSHIHDSTNDQDICPRNRLRHHVIPRLRFENPSIARASLFSGIGFREDETYLAGQAARLLEDARRQKGWSVPVLSQAPRPLRMRALRSIIEAEGGGVSLAHLEAAERLLSAAPGASLNLPGLILRRQYDLLLCGSAEDGQFDPFFLPLPGQQLLPGNRMLICDGPLTYENGLGFCLSLSAPPLVRPRRPGDRLRLPGGTKSVKELMINRKIPAVLRPGVPVLELDGTVIAVWGVGVNPAFHPSPGDRCYRLQLLEKETERCIQ